MKNSVPAIRKSNIDELCSICKPIVFGPNSSYEERGTRFWGEWGNEPLGVLLHAEPVS